MFTVSCQPASHPSRRTDTKHQQPADETENQRDDFSPTWCTFNPLHSKQTYFTYLHLKLKFFINDSLFFCSAVMQQKHITHSGSHFKRHTLTYENCLCPRISFILSICDLFQKRSAEPPTFPGWASWSRCRSRRDEGLKFQSLAGSSVLTGGEAVWREGTRSWSQSAKTPQRSPRRGGTLQPGWSRRSPEIQRLNTGITCLLQLWEVTDYIY